MCFYEHPIPPSNLPTTLGSLRASGYQSRSVREEIRRNLESRLAEGIALTSSVLGFEDTVLPQLETALLPGTTSSCWASVARPSRESFARW